MQTVKQIIHEIADHLSDQATWDDAMYSMYVRHKIEQGIKASEEGRTLTHEEAKRRILSKFNKLA